VEIDVPEGAIAARLSRHIGELIAVVGLPGGSSVTGFRRGAWRMLRFGVDPTISRLLLAIIATGVDHLLRSSCRRGFPNFI
jgi:hypothetical protein